MFDIFYSGKKPNLFAHEKSADSIEQAQSLSRTRFFWWVHYLADYSDFDFLWQPVPWQSNYTHTWPNQWHKHSGTYLVPKKGTVDNYHFHQQVIPNKNQSELYKFFQPNADFDTTWAPHPHDPPYIYVFGNQWWPPNIMPTVEYCTPEATEHKYMDYPKAKLTDTHSENWVKLVDCDWDATWVPDPGDPPYIYVFGNQWWSAEKMPTVEYHVKGATERKYVNWPRAQLLPNQQCWTVPHNVDESTVDFSWVPDPGDPPYVYQFGTQHQRTGGPVYTVPGGVDVKFVDQIKAKVDSGATAIYEIDHMCGAVGQIPNTTKTVRYFDNYRDTLIRLAKSVNGKHEFIWVCSSVCNYANFDFSWHPEQWQATMLHVFASGSEKFGDTFFMHVPTFALRAEKKALLEWYDLNFIDTSVPRRAIPVISHDHDSHVEPVKTIDWVGPLALFTNTNNIPIDVPAVPLWRESTKNIVPLTKGATSVVVPKASVPYVKTQLYDYAYIDRTNQKSADAPLNVIFQSNGESTADANYQHLREFTVGTNNKVIRVDRVTGRVAAHHVSASTSETSWYFLIPAKLQVNKDFDWTWQPDRMQESKHYIFHAVNPINGLTYGHMAMIAYNKKLALENHGKGLDFAMDQEHEVVPIVSGTACYQDSDWMCWRTAFREVTKLKASLPDVESAYRLDKWLNVDTTTGQWSRKGAEDAVEYYDSVGGDFDALKKTYEWAWLADYAWNKRSLIPN